MKYFKKKTDQEKMLEERKKIIKNLKNSLSELGLFNDEVTKVLAIANAAQDKIEKIKESLIGTNIDQNPLIPLYEAEQQIDAITQKMVSDIEAQVTRFLNKTHREQRFNR